jgi:hypothetical protein
MLKTASKLVILPRFKCLNPRIPSSRILVDMFCCYTNCILRWREYISLRTADSRCFEAAYSRYLSTIPASSGEQSTSTYSRLNWPRISGKAVRKVFCQSLRVLCASLSPPLCSIWSFRRTETIDRSNFIYKRAKGTSTA